MNFADWYERIYGRPPFPWQIRLAENIADGVWPRSIDLPTGSGKTAIVAVWAWARWSGKSGIPRRLWYVVDRRLIVDEVLRQAEILAGYFGAHAPEFELLPVRLRGGMVPDDTWVDDPARPAIISTTVDQIGSRLLFRGYGVSGQAAPMHAALAGNDALIVLDEAHLSTAFFDTLRAVERLRADALGLPWRVFPMTATPVAGTGEVFGLDAEDRAHPVLAQRLRASKPATLAEPVEAGELAGELARQAVALREGGAGVVAVVCNLVRTAREVFERLREQGEAVLLTGRIRPTDRERLLEEWLPRLRTGSRAMQREPGYLDPSRMDARPEPFCGPPRPCYVVATQTIEVGADLDFDALVTESAPIAALEQRFGRLNRLGELDVSPAVIVHPKLAKKHPVYGEAVNEAWKWLNAKVETAKAEKGKGRKSAGKADKILPVVDFGLDAFTARKAVNPPPLVEPVKAPPLLPAHLRALRHTSPQIPLDIAPWLHGWQAGKAEVQLAWRADLREGRESEWAEIAEAVPPILGELLNVPCYAAGAWLVGVDAATADMEGVAIEEQPSGGRWVVIVRGDEPPVMTSSARIAPGDTVLVPCSYGGCDAWGWNPGLRGEVADLGDLWNGGEANARRRLRLHPDVHPEWAEEIRAVLAEEEPDFGELLDRLEFPEQWRKVRAYPGGVLAETGMWRTDAGAVREVRLGEHVRAVGREAERLARACDLPGLAPVLRRAGLGHDAGKLDPGFQIALGARSGRPLAKSGQRRAEEREAAWRLSGLPRGWRHEVASVARLAGRVGELERYLIGVHHGHGHPWLPKAPDPERWAQAGGADWPGLAARLAGEYGAWGLAYLELLVRLADWRVSAEEQRPKGV